MLFILSFNFSVIGQYLFVELFPIKEFVLLGMSRFTMFGYWMIAILWTIILSELLNRKLKNINTFLKKFNVNLSPAFFAAIIISIFIALIIIKDNPKKTHIAHNNKLSNFISKTDKNAVFAAPLNNIFPETIQLIHKRSVFVGNTFPFNEKYFKEYNNRRKALYGSSKNKSIYFHKLSLKDFKEIQKKYKLDYVIFDKNKIKNKFTKVEAVYNGDKYIIYKL